MNLLEYLKNLTSNKNIAIYDQKKGCYLRDIYYRITTTKETMLNSARVEMQYQVVKSYNAVIIDNGNIYDIIKIEIK